MQPRIQTLVPIASPMVAGKPLLTFKVHTDDSREGAGPGTNVDVVKAFGCSLVKVVAASGTTTPLVTRSVVSNTFD